MKVNVLESVQVWNDEGDTGLEVLAMLMSWRIKSYKARLWADLKYSQATVV